MDVGLRALGVSARADRADDLTLAEGRPGSDRNRSQVDERHGVSVLGADRQTAAGMRNLAGEGHDPGHRSAHVGAGLGADVDSAVLSASVRVVAGDEGPEHRPLDGPAPPGRARHESERDEQCDSDAVA